MELVYVFLARLGLHARFVARLHVGPTIDCCSALLILGTVERIAAGRTCHRPLRHLADQIFVAKVLRDVLDRAMGLTDNTPLAYWYGHERGARIYDGPDEVHKTLVARSILKRYGVGNS